MSTEFAEELQRRRIKGGKVEYKVHEDDINTNMKTPKPMEGAPLIKVGDGRLSIFVVMVLLISGCALVVISFNKTYLRDNMTSFHKSSEVDSGTQMADQKSSDKIWQAVDYEAAGAQPRAVGGHWLLFPTYANETEVFLHQLSENETVPCYKKSTSKAHVFGLPKPSNGQPIQLRTGKVYDLLIVAFEENGKRRCAGGDYFETDLTGPHWKSRPPVLDLQNGTYTVKLLVDSRFAGLYVFEVVLLFGNFHALHLNCTPWARFLEVTTIEIEFVFPLPLSYNSTITASKLLPDLRKCTREDFSFKAWSGRWTRHRWNNSCTINEEGRFVCLDPSEQCQNPWCEGPLGLLESNGWVYSAHCRFKIFEEAEAWKCLNGRWLFFWGDSNNEDTVRNLLNFVLGFQLSEVTDLRRWFDGTFTYPKDKTYNVRITKIFNGHAKELGNLHGLFCLQDKAYREMLESFFNGSVAPDTVVMNSGLHDAHYYSGLKQFLEEGVEYATRFWEALWGDANQTAPRPAIIYRTTVAGAGYAREKFGHARDGVPNPHKMEVYNRVFVERLQRLNLPSFKLVDAFDLTFPWHYDLNHTDGVHYGKKPSKSPWMGSQIGHQYLWI